MVDRFKRRSDRPTIPRVEKKTARPQPPRRFPRPTKGAYVGGPGIAPAWIITPTTSVSEWYIYWALRKIKGDAGDGNWGYQISSNNSKTIIDFVIWDANPRIAIRVQSERFHIAVPNDKHRYDKLQREMLERSGYKVIDVYEEHFLRDKTGQAAILIVKDALKGIQKPTPIKYRTGASRPARTGN